MYSPSRLGANIIPSQGTLIPARGDMHRIEVNGDIAWVLVIEKEVIDLA